jgi:hypothetical protein
MRRTILQRSLNGCCPGVLELHAIVRKASEEIEMIKIIATLCSLAFPAACREQVVTTSDFADISLTSCMMGAPQLADWMKQHPADRLAGWRCTAGAGQRPI